MTSFERTLQTQVSKILENQDQLKVRLDRYETETEFRVKIETQIQGLKDLADRVGTERAMRDKMVQLDAEIEKIEKQTDWKRR